MIELISVLAMPFIVKAVTGVAKNLQALPQGDWRVAAIRGVVALLSLSGALLTQLIPGSDGIDISMMETTLLTIVNGVAATALYFYSKRN